MSIGTARARLPLYNALRQAALAQKEALQSNDLETFQHLLAQREELLAGIEQLDADESCGAGAPGEIDGDPQLLATALLAEIIRTDRELHSLLSVHIDETRADLCLLRTGRQTSRAYLSPGGTAGLFVDRQS